MGTVAAVPKKQTPKVPKNSLMTPPSQKFGYHYLRQYPKRYPNLGYHHEDHQSNFMKAPSQNKQKNENGDCNRYL